MFFSKLNNKLKTTSKPKKLLASIGLLGALAISTSFLGTIDQVNPSGMTQGITEVKNATVEPIPGVYDGNVYLRWIDYETNQPKELIVLYPKMRDPMNWNEGVGNYTIQLREDNWIVTRSDNFRPTFPDNCETNGSIVNYQGSGTYMYKGVDVDGNACYIDM